MQPEAAMHPDDVIQRFQSHVQRLKHVLSLCEEQETLIDRGEMTELMRLLSKKNPIVHSLGGDAAQIRVGLESADLMPNDPVRSVLQSLKTQCDELGQAILAAEQRCEAKMVQSKIEIQSRIQSLHDGSDATSSYQSVDQNTSTDGGSTLDFQCG